MSSDIFLGKSTDTENRVVFPSSSRQYHLHVLGQFGLGKSKFLEHLIRQDIQSGSGLCLIDPHGSLYDAVTEWCALNEWFDRRKVVLFEPSLRGWLFGYNPLSFSGMETDDVAVAVDNMVKACAQVWGGEDMSKTPRLMRVLPALFFALGEQGLTLREAPDLLASGMLRDFLVSQIRDPFVKDEWSYLGALPPSEFIQQTESTRNRLASFLRHPMVRTMVGQTENTLDFSASMESGDVVLINLGGLPPHTARLIGSLMVSDLYSRARLREPDVSPPFFLYLDECHQFLNDDVERIVTELRKFGLWLIAAHQNLGQVRHYGGEAVESAIMQIPNKVVFGGLPTRDAGELVNALYLGEIDYERPKRSMDKPVTVDHIVKRLWSVADAQGFSTGSSLSTQRAYGGEQGPAETETASQQLNESSTDGWSESLAPVFEWLPTVLYSIEEQVQQHMSTLVGLSTQQAVVKLFQQAPTQIRVPFVKEAGVSKQFVEEQKLLTNEKCNHALPRLKAESLLQDRRRKLLDAAKKSVRDLEPSDKDFLE